MNAPHPTPIRAAGLNTRESADCHAAPRPTLTPTSWGPHTGMSFAAWVEQGRRLGVMGRGVGWWIGDWLRFGNAAYGERYAAAARVTGYDRQSLMNMVYVASRVESSRRREKLSWSHHAEVAAFDPPEQEAWLDRAERDSLSVRCLREAIRTERRGMKAREAAEAAEAAGEPPVAEIAHSRSVCPSCGRPIESEREDRVAA